jgi:hypothetical protein
VSSKSFDAHFDRSDKETFALKQNDTHSSTPLYAHGFGVDLFAGRLFRGRVATIAAQYLITALSQFRLLRRTVSDRLPSTSHSSQLTTQWSTSLVNRAYSVTVKGVTTTLWRGRGDSGLRHCGTLVTAAVLTYR